MRRIFAAAVSAALVVSGALVAGASSPEPAAAAPPDLSVVTYNVRSCCASGGKLLTGSQTWSKRRPYVEANLGRTRADVIALQEVTPYHTTSGTQKKADGKPVNAPNIHPALGILKTLRAQHPDKAYEMTPSDGRGARAIIYSSKRLTRVPMGSANPELFSPGGRQVSTALFADKSANNQRFVVASLHQLSGQDKSDETERVKTIKAIYAAVQSRANSAALGANGRVLYAGDFNTYPGAPASAGGYASGKWLAAQTHVGDAYALAPASARGPHKDKYATYKGGFGGRVTGPKNYDRVFVQVGNVGTWKVAGYETLSQVDGRGSDHWPVRVKMRW